MSVKGFNTGTGVEKYDYNSLDNIPITTNTRVKGDAEAEYRTGDVNLTKANIGLGNVDNTSDANKPVSTAQQTALNGKVDKVTGKQLSTEDYTTAEKTKLSGIEAEANKTVLDSTLTEEGQAADAKATGDAVADLSRQINHFDDNLPGTVQTVNFGADGKPSSVVHTKNGATVRTDAYTWGDGTVTETRTTADGSYITMVTNLSTLVTTISEIQEAS